ncbi:hypothetical protein KP509_02G052500 [Ceratopteris richardii]|nr:hypothetical protein KP509_02G052500 [Ceratopteris richardii]
METYAEFRFPPHVHYKTKTDLDGAVNPSWREKFGFLIPEHTYQSGEGDMNIEIFTRSMLGEKFVCQTKIPFLEITKLPILNHNYERIYPLKTETGEFHGELIVHFAVHEKLPITGDDAKSNFPIYESSQLFTSHQLPAKLPPPREQESMLYSSAPVVYQKPSPALPVVIPPTKALHPPAGTAQPIYTSAHGKPYQSFAPSEFLEAYRQPMTINAPTHITMLPEKLAHGYADHKTNVMPRITSNLLFGGPVGKLLLTEF